MRLRYPLYAQVLTFLALQFCVFLIFPLANLWAMHEIPNWKRIVRSQLGDRVEIIIRLIQEQTEIIPESMWTEMTQRFGQYYNTTIFLYDLNGTELAGDRIQLPSQVKDALASKNRSILQTQSANITLENWRATTNEQTDFSREFSKFTMPPTTVGAPPSVNSAADRTLIYVPESKRYWLVVFTPLYRQSEHKFVPGAVLCATDDLSKTNLVFDRSVPLKVASFLAFASCFWFPFAFRITSELRKMSKLTEKIADGHFESRLPINRFDEVGLLGESINSMAEKLQAFVSGEKRFLGDIAHELSSPIARLQLALELLEDASPEEREKTIQTIRTEAEEMSTLINEILAFSKAGLRGKELQLVALNLETILLNVVQKCCAEKIVHLTLDKNISVLGDQVLLERGFGNIIRNAVRYAGSYGPIELTAKRNNGDIVVVIADSGPGVPPEVIHRLGEPFFRAEPSRSRASGGTGLGLAIVKTCIQACGGTFSARNREPKGLEIEVTLKAVPIGATEPA